MEIRPCAAAEPRITLCVGHALAGLALISAYLLVRNMNASILLLTFVCLAAHAYVIDEAPEDQAYLLGLKRNKGNLVGFLEDLKDKLRKGDKDLGLPALDPFESLQEVVEFEKEGLAELSALLTNVHSKGLSNYEVVEGNFAVIGMKLKLGLKWPEITAKTDYNAKGLLGGVIPVFGNGHLSVIVENLSFSTQVALSIKNKHLYVRSISSQISLGGLDLRITGLFDDEELSKLISHAISDMTPQLIQDYQVEVEKEVNGIIKSKADEFLSTKTLKDLLDMIKG